MANTFIDLPNDGQVRIDGYVQTNPNVDVTGHVSIDGYVQTNPVVQVSNFPATTTVIQPSGSNLHVDIDGYVQTNPNVLVKGDVSIDGYVQIKINGAIYSIPYYNT